ncbi:MAG TPA: hypothetical protein VMK65_12395, partial [Longimicrobiales bacterium]|nr:hypothetical protein [Longimicrobiales bacterium]
MLLPWMLYCAAVSALLSAAAFALERILRWSGLPTRLPWAAGLVASLGFAAAAWLGPAAGVLWALLSLAVLLAALGGALALRRERRRWSAATLDG